MCGICGVLDYSEDRIINENLISRMCAEMKHRGPDDEGIYIDKDKPLVGLGHRRLSIIDLSAFAHQPMSNEDKTIWLICNGEIYNYKDLKIGLEEKGHKFKSDTDSETIIHLYEEYGDKCLDFLRGMFAFAIWDVKKKTLLLARDRIGKKPLLYYHANGRFCFASEFISLLASGMIEKRINPAALHHYLTFGYVPAPLTIYEGIFKVPPAHLLILNNNTITLRRYWQLDYFPKIKISEQEAVGEIMRLLKEAVKIRLYSDVPLGAFLSGGIDSSTIVALMSQVSSAKVKTFSIGFQEGDYNELKYASNIAKRFNTEHHEFIVKPKAMEILPLLVEHYGEPYADSSCIPTYYVCEQAKKYVSVALCGDGGDESFAGYERYQAMQIAELYQKLPGAIRNIVSVFTNMLPDSINPRDKFRRIKRFYAAANLPFKQRYLRWVGIFDDSLKREIYTEDFLKAASGMEPLSFIGPFLDNNSGLDLIDRLMMTDVNTYLLNDLLVKVDIASMVNSLELRSPFLDHRVMEFAAKLPVKYKMNNLVKKYILKKSLKNLLPEKNIHRRKMGFGVPMGKWLRGELKGFLCDTLLSKESMQRGYFAPGCIKKMLSLHTEAREDFTYQLWALLMLELWHKRFIDK